MAAVAVTTLQLQRLEEMVVDDVANDAGDADRELEDSAGDDRGDNGDDREQL